MKIIIELIFITKGKANNEEGSYAKTKQKLNNLLLIIIFVGGFFFVFIRLMKKYYI